MPPFPLFFSFVTSPLSKPMPTRPLLLALATAALGNPLAAQAPLVMDAWAGGALESADALYFAGDPEGAFELLREHLDENPHDYDALWRIVRSTVVLGAAGDRWQEQNPWWDAGMMYGDTAVAVRPDGIDGRYWRAAAYGRRALNAVAEYGAELAEVAYGDAHAILEVDPGHGGAHNVLAGSSSRS